MTKPTAAPQLSTPPGEQVADLSRSPLPTARTLKKRQNVFYQFVRFLSFNARMAAIVLKGHE